MECWFLCMSGNLTVNERTYKTYPGKKEGVVSAMLSKLTKCFLYHLEV